MEHKLQFSSTACENGTFVKKQNLVVFSGFSLGKYEHEVGEGRGKGNQVPWSVLLAHRVSGIAATDL